MRKIILRRRIGQRVLGGHPWVFGNEIDKIDDGLADGDIADVMTHEGEFVGRGYVNTQSAIVVRILTRDRGEAVDAAFFHRRISRAWDYRRRLGYVENCRVVFGEADDLPQLIIDKFNDHLVIQTLALGIDRWKPVIVDALRDIFNPRGIYERNDVPVRELEGLPQQKGFLSDPFDTRIIVQENGLKFNVDLDKGQKTGYFLDQQDNRRAIRHIAEGADVLGAFCYTGTFELHAAQYGARKVTGLDISAQAVEQARANAVLNGLDGRCEFVEVNAFDALKAWTKEERRWDVVMLDPPSFARTRGNIEKAVTGYKEINLRGMKLVRPGGFLVTSSCTSVVQPELFLDVIDMAARDARRRLRQVEYRTQSADHPVVRGLENTHYLKFLIVQVL
ncbi:MAG: class I SAM-dependent rRNA methyltransferase [Chitinophagia bacterium]|nr:class I SAM-dependent rRNA methyltransferase [Chitinophagia bacterium]